MAKHCVDQNSSQAMRLTRHCSRRGKGQRFFFKRRDRAAEFGRYPCRDRFGFDSGQSETNRDWQLRVVSKRPGSAPWMTAKRVYVKLQTM